MFSLPAIPAQEDMLLVTDELASPADFILHANLAAHLRDPSKKTRCIVLSVSESLARWKSLASKSNLNVSHLATEGSLVLVDVSSRLADLADGPRLSLLPLFEELQRLLGDPEHKDASTLLILDDLSTLEWIGFSTEDVSRFARALCALGRQMNLSLIVRHHMITPGSPDDLLRILLQLCTSRIDVFPLSTGRSGSVSGQIAMYHGPGWVVTGWKTIPRSNAVLYRLTDSGCTFFERGTGSTVL